MLCVRSNTYQGMLARQASFLCSVFSSQLQVVPIQPRPPLPFSSSRAEIFSVCFPLYILLDKLDKFPSRSLRSCDSIIDRSTKPKINANLKIDSSEFEITWYPQGHGRKLISVSSIGSMHKGQVHSESASPSTSRCFRSISRLCSSAATATSGLQHTSKYISWNTFWRNESVYFKRQNYLLLTSKYRFWAFTADGTIDAPVTWTLWADILACPCTWPICDNRGEMVEFA